jgi:ubiquinone biosynthesis protein COQ9
MVEPAEMTLDELREAMAPLVPAHAAFDGWSDEALGHAADELGVPAARARLCFPGGAAEMIDAWFEAIDVAMLKAFPPERIASMKIRERIRDLVMYRKEVAHPHREALRRAVAILAQPQNLGLASRLAWRTVDRIWRLAGDTATDYNHYTKRAILLGVYTSTTLVYLDDNSDDLADTRAFLNRRIDDVMKFEKYKASWRGSRERMPSLSRFLGRLRYPAV